MTAHAPDHVVGPFLRATVLASGRAVDVVLPTEQPVAALVPVVLQLLGFPDDGRLRHVATVDGRLLAAELPLGDAGLRDGVQLRVVEATEAPSDPVVYDLVDAVEEERPTGVWDARQRSWGLAVVVLMLLTGAAVVASAVPGVDGPTVLAALGALALVGSLAASRWVGAPTAWVGFAAGWLLAGAATVLSVQATGEWPVGWLVVSVPLVAMGAAWCLDRPRAALASVAAWVAVLVAGGTTQALSGEVRLSSSVVAVVATALLGLLPRLALATTGAFAVDTDLGRGLDLRSRRVGRAVTSAHLGLAAAVVLVAAAGGGALLVAAVTAPGDPWVLSLVGTQAAAWVVRTRHFPLVLERLVVLAAGVTGAVALAVVAVDRSPVAAAALSGVLVGAAAVVVVVLVRRPGALAAATTRRWAARLETVAVLAGIPLLVGAFGAYADLLSTF